MKGGGGVEEEGGGGGGGRREEKQQRQSPPMQKLNLQNCKIHIISQNFLTSIFHHVLHLSLVNLKITFRQEC